MVPFLIAACPLIAFLFLRRLRVIRKSFALTLVTTLLTTALSLGTTFLSIVFCANAMAAKMPDDGAKCVTGAVMFLPIGLVLTVITFLIGLVLTVQSFRLQLSDAPLHK